ncbi:MAG: serine hydrolase [Actinomycetota bacterium]
MREARVPGLAACIVKDGAITWEQGYGRANIANSRLATPDTIFMLASISKTVMAVAVMQAVEDGLLDLDADVNEALPFPVRNPRHPDAPITIRMLLTHTSSIRDDWPTIIPFYSHGDSPITLGDYLDRYLMPGGDLRPAPKLFGLAAGSAVRLLQPRRSPRGLSGRIGLRHRLRPVVQRPDLHAARHEPHQLAPKGARSPPDRDAVSLPGPEFVAYGQYGYPDYPDGELRTSARQLSHHLVAFMQFGEFAGTRILQEATVREMRRVQDANVAHGQGLIWYRFALRDMALMATTAATAASRRRCISDRRTMSV